MVGWVLVYAPCDDISEHQNAFAKEDAKPASSSFNWTNVAKLMYLLARAIL